MFFRSVLWGLKMKVETSSESIRFSEGFGRLKRRLYRI